MLYKYYIKTKKKTSPLNNPILCISIYDTILKTPLMYYIIIIKPPPPPPSLQKIIKEKKAKMNKNTRQIVSFPSVIPFISSKTIERICVPVDATQSLSHMFVIAVVFLTSGVSNHLGLLLLHFLVW
jgi:hypothetical protein